MTILDTVQDGALFKSWFESPSWRRWWVALAAIFALPITVLQGFGIEIDEAMAIYREHTGRSMWPLLPALEFWGLIGRRGGKSRVMALTGCFVACFRSYRFAPGERGIVMLLAADKRQARVLRRYIGAFLQGVPMLAAMIERETRESIDLSNGVTIEIRFANYRTTRGETVVAMIGDEICFWRTDDDSANPDTEILNALRPAMATIPGALLMAISSPYAKRGEAWKTFRRHWAQDESRVLVWRARTQDMNPSVDPDVIARAYADDEVAARSEYGGEWRDDVLTFLDREQIEALVDEGVTVRPFQSKSRFKAHCDPSGGRADSMTQSIGHAEGDQIVIDCVLERKPPFQPSVVVGDFATVLRSYGLDTVQVDNYAAEWVAESFRKEGIDVRVADRSTSDHYRELLPVVTGGRVALVDEPRLVNQLAGLERRISRSGHEVISHAPGGHDDLAAAVAGVVAQLAGAKRGGAATDDVWWL